jgi:putative transposase
MDFYLNKNYFFITCRTLLQEKYFLEDFKKEIILEQLKEIEKIFNLKFDAYSILSNHYHLLFYLDRGEDLKKIMQKLNGATSYKLNILNKVNRAIWDEYHNINVLDEKTFYNIIGYIIGNPFKHGLVKNIDELKDYKFCNYNEKVKEFGKQGIDEIICRVRNLNWEINLS